MSEHEDMLRAWTIMLMSVLNGLTLAVAAMVLAGEEKRIVEVSMEVMRDMTDAYTPDTSTERKRLLSSQLGLLCSLANTK